MTLGIVRCNVVALGVKNSFWRNPKVIYSGAIKIPKGFLNYFPNFIGLFSWGCPISTLNGDELDEYPNLEFYSQEKSYLVRVPGNFFKSTPKMKVFNFYGKKIQNVGVNLFNHLIYLQQLYFDENTCINKDADSASEVPALIEELIQKCPDIEPETTTLSTQIHKSF
jgi:hypothetical protein